MEHDQTDARNQSGSVITIREPEQGYKESGS